MNRSINPYGFLEHLRDNFGATIYDGVVALDLACGPGPSCFQEVIDLRADDFRNARHFVIDPIDQNFFIAVGPTAQDPSAPAILRLVIDPATGGGTVVGQVTVEIPRFVTVNR